MKIELRERKILAVAFNLSTFFDNNGHMLALFSGGSL